MGIGRSKNRIHPSSTEFKGSKSSENKKQYLNLGICGGNMSNVYDPLEDNKEYWIHLKENFSKLDKLNVRVMTWNLRGQSAPSEEELKKVFSLGSDIFAIGTQECCNSIPKSFLNRSKSGWEDELVKYFGKEYEVIRSITLIGIHLIVFIKKELRKFVKSIQLMSIPTGFLNETVPNKGAVSISFQIFKQKMLFVNCHLTAYQENHEIRDSNYQKIAAVLTDNYQCSSVFNLFENIFWFGDLNYRVDGTRKLSDLAIKQKMFDVLLQNCQLKKSIENKRAFYQLKEGTIHFPPTYKFDKGTNNYDTKKLRIPSWTDRIFYKINENSSQIDYNANFECLWSDHMPVFSNFEIVS